MNQTCQSHKTCSCALAAIDLFAKLHDLLSIYNEHARTGKLPATAIEIREEIESASEHLKRVGESCGINIEHPETFLENAITHYEAGLLRGDIHSLSEAAEIAAEAELPLLRELWSCQEKEGKG
ncbi:MAG TPA: hypothetical protein VMW64_04360 [Dehalococcoidia bacterium]|nr:hypothetical protein [Dehalococcoidia bacterium]